MPQENILESLQETFDYYFDNVVEQVSIATYVSGGKRPECLTNEIYSAFHHISRAFVAFPENVSGAIDQIQKAKNSHLKRAALDSYKIILNDIFLQDKQLTEVLDYLVLVEDYEKYIPEGLEKLTEIRRLRNEVRLLYKKARWSESKGDPDKAISEFNEALDQASELSNKITDFTENKVYLLAVAREAHERKEKKRDRTIAIVAAIISGLLGGTIGYLLK